MATFHLEVQPDMQLRVFGGGGDVRVTGHDHATIEVETDGDESLERYLRQEGNTITILGYPSDLRITLPHQASVELNGIGGDVEVRAVGGDLGARAMAKLSAHGIGGDVRVADVAQIDLESIGGDATIEHNGDTTDANQHVKAGRVGGDFTIRRAAQLSLHVVGGDANLGQVERLESLGHIGGDLNLTLGNLEGNIRTIVGGDVKLDLSDAAQLTLVATVGGDVNAAGEEWNLRRGAGRHRLVFGEGGSELQLMIGGDLRVRGGSAPQQATGFAGHHGEGSADWQDFRGTMEDFGQDMRGFGKDLEEMGRTLARDLSNLGRDIAREVRIAGRESLRDAARGYRAGRGGPGRGYGQQGDFGFDPEQIERIKREARAAAVGGIARAQEAVEQALQQWQQGGRGPGGRQVPPQPRGPVPPARGPVPPRPPQPPFTGQTVRIEREHEEQAQQPEQAQPAEQQASASQPANRDAERLAILRMVHEGRLAPDEAEMLLRGLDGRS
ncbi:MAG: hypothetical protein JOZ51_15595 [Chloroflexi bacterium]|nr:hypothetical protein [Chloroflexota bacterium]